MNPPFIPRTKMCLVFEEGFEYSGKIRLNPLNNRKLKKGSEKKSAN